MFWNQLSLYFQIYRVIQRFFKLLCFLKSVSYLWSPNNHDWKSLALWSNFMSKLLQCLSRRFLNVFMFGLFTTSAGRLFHGLATLRWNEWCFGCRLLAVSVKILKLCPLVEVSLVVSVVVIGIDSKKFMVSRAQIYGKITNHQALFAAPPAYLWKDFLKNNII